MCEREAAFRQENKFNKLSPAQSLQKLILSLETFKMEVCHK